MSYLVMDQCAAHDCSKMIISFWFRQPKIEFGPEFPWPLKYSKLEQFPFAGTAIKHPLDTIWDRNLIIPQKLTSVGNDNQTYKTGDPVEGGKAGIPIVASLSGGFDPRLSILGAAQTVPGTQIPPSMDGVWPLITFGANDTKHKRAQWDVVRTRGCPVVLTTQGPPFAVEAPIANPPAVCSWQLVGGVEETDDLVPQSFIGIYNNPITAQNLLRICLWTKTFANYNNWSLVLTEGKQIIHQHWTWVFNPDPPFQKLGEQYAAPYPGGYEFHWEDKSDDTCNEVPESFLIDFNCDNLNVWNHALLSFDISGSVQSESLGPIQVFSQGATHVSTCKLWLALNDRDMPILQDLGADAGNQRNTLPAHTIVTRAATFIKGLDPRIACLWHTEPAKFPPLFDGDHNSEFYGHGPPPNQWGKLEMPKWSDPKTFSLPKYDGSNFLIPIEHYPIGIPVADEYVDRNGGVEMAELQIWFNKLIDTSDVSNRRLFITEEGKPADMKDAEDALGKPDIRLHGSSNWIHGKNTGSLGVDDKGQTIPSGQFNPVALIRKFKPDPKVGV